MTDDTAIVREALTWFGTVALSSAHPLISELGEGVLRDAGAALGRLTARLDAERGKQWRHLKRGTVYTEVGRGELQMASDLVDGSTLVSYRGEDGRLWFREKGEFEDGRFEALPTPPEADHG